VKQKSPESRFTNRKVHMKNQLKIAIVVWIIVISVTGNFFAAAAEPAFMAVPDKPNPVSPRGYDNFSRTLTFYWNPAANAENYTVYWNSDNGDSGNLTLAASDASCGGGRCAVSTTLPFEGEYHLYVAAINTEGTVNSDTIDFTLNSNISTPDAYSPSGTVYDNRFTTFTFTDVQDNVKEYRIRVLDVYSSRVVMDRYWSVDEISCEANQCSITTDTFLPGGNYVWRVRGYSDNSASNWSNELGFYVYCTTCGYSTGSTGTSAYTNPVSPTVSAFQTNTVPTPVSPTGTISDLIPVFQWRTLTGANFYWITLYDASGKVLYNNTSDSSICNYETCTFSPGFSLPAAGNYSWQVAGGTNTGVTWGSASTTFTLVDAPKAISFIRPVDGGVIGTSGSSILWTDAGSLVENFTVVIYDSSNQVLLNTTMDRGTLWCDGTQCTLEFTSIPAGAYRIEVTPNSTYGAQAASASLNFTVSDVSQTIEIIYPKDNSAVQPRPLFRWKIPQSPEETITFVIQVTGSDGNTAQIGPISCGKSGLTCTENEAFFIPSDSLPSGSYSWTVHSPELNASSEPALITVE
jgi:hypothetical protein